MLQRQHADGQRRYTRVLGGAGGPPRGAQIPCYRGWRIAVRAGQGRHGTGARRGADGLSQLPQMDGEYSGSTSADVVASTC